MKKEKRKLIKFSNYSLCVTLPKSVVKDFGWEKGDEVTLEVDQNKETIHIYKGKKAPKSQKKEPGDKTRDTKNSKENEDYSRW